VFDKIRGDLLRLSPLPKLEESFVMMLKKDGKTESSIVILSKARSASFSFPRPTLEEKENMHYTYCNGNRHTE
ncbi:unnamed protein product, partial [Prunus brigantina]